MVLGSHRSSTALSTETSTMHWRCCCWSHTSPSQESCTLRGAIRRGSDRFLQPSPAGPLVSSVTSVGPEPRSKAPTPYLRPAAMFLLLPHSLTSDTHHLFPAFIFHESWNFLLEPGKELFYSWLSRGPDFLVLQGHLSSKLEKQRVLSFSLNRGFTPFPEAVTPA